MLRKPFVGDLNRLQDAINHAWRMRYAGNAGSSPEAEEWAEEVHYYHTSGACAKVSPTYEDVCSAATVLRNRSIKAGDVPTAKAYIQLRGTLGCNTHIIPTDWPPPGGHSSQRPERSEGDRMFDFFFPKKKDGGFLGLPSWKRRRR